MTGRWARNGEWDRKGWPGYKDLTVDYNGESKCFSEQRTQSWMLSRIMWPGRSTERITEQDLVLKKNGAGSESETSRADWIWCLHAPE